VVAWVADNSAPYKRKAAALAFGTMTANMGGLFSVWVSVKKFFFFFFRHHEACCDLIGKTNELTGYFSD
jgi:hypothetical protein